MEDEKGKVEEDSNKKEEDSKSVFGWKDDDDIQEEEEEVVAEVSAPINENLKKEQVEKLLKKYQARYPGVKVRPLIISTGAKAGENRVYIIKAIMTDEIEKHEDTIDYFRGEVLGRARKRAKNKWYKEKGLDKDAKLNSMQEAELDEFIAQYIMTKQQEIGNEIDRLSVNATGVIWPEGHTQAISEGKIPIGDAMLIQSAVLVISGYSDMSLDVESMDDEEVDDIYGSLE